MKLFLLVFILILSPEFSWSNSLSNGEDFLVDDSQRSASTTAAGSRISTSPTSSLRSDVGGTLSRERVGEQGENLNATSGFQVTQSGGLGNANDAASSGSATQLIGLAMGAGFAKTCSTPSGQWACPLAVMSFADALSAGKASKDAANTAAVLDSNTGLPIDGSGTGQDTYNDQAATGLQDLARMGFTLNPDGSVSTPNGSTLTADDFSSQESLMTKGLSPEMARQAMQGMSDVQKNALAESGVNPEEAAGSGQALGLMAAGQGSGGGYSSGGGQAANDRIVEEVVFLNGKNKKKKERMPAAEAAELSKNFNGTPIGIGMADLFLIVHKKYREKKDSNTREFITREY